MIEKEFKSDVALANQVDISAEDIDKLVKMTKGYSGSDLKNLSTEAALMPLREITDVANCSADNIRPLRLQDFEEALKNVRATVKDCHLKAY